MTLLQDSHVLVTGGADAKGTVLASRYVGCWDQTEQCFMVRAFLT